MSKWTLFNPATAFIYSEGTLALQDKPVPFSKKLCGAFALCVSVCVNPTELIKLLISLSSSSQNLTRYCMLNGWNTQSCTYTQAHTKPRKAFLTKCVPGCLLKHTHSHTDAHTHAAAAQHSYLNWCECCHDIRLVLFVPQKPWRERAGSPHWLSCKSIQYTHARAHTHRRTHAHT